MAFRQYVLTMNGSAQRLGTSVSLTDNAESKHAIWVSLQPDTANAAVIKIGDANVSSSLYAFRLEIPATTVPPAPFIFDLGQLEMSIDDIYVLGANNEKLRVGVVYG